MAEQDKEPSEPAKSEHFRKYVGLMDKLVKLIDDDLDDSPEGDALRDEMDHPWYQMTPEERANLP